MNPTQRMHGVTGNAGSFKKELVHHEDYQTRAEARQSIFEYIEVFYNQERLHSALGYVSPNEYERQYEQVA